MLENSNFDASKSAQVSISERLNALARPSVNVTSVAEAAFDGVAPKAKEILTILSSAPSNLAASAAQVRSIRKAMGNPYDYQENGNISREDFLIPTRCGSVRARRYSPNRPRRGAEAVLVYFHGGGFVLGDIDSYDKLVGTLSELADLAIISVEYRLAPEHPFPAPLEDVQDTYSWVCENTEQLKIDKNKIALGGDSAGANMAAATCMLNRDNGKPQPVLQLLLYPSTAANKGSKSRDDFSKGYFLTKEILKWYHDHYISPKMANDPRFNILDVSDLSNLPPAFVLTCGFDPLRDEGEAFAEKLRAAGGTVRHSCYTDMFHAFLNFGVLPQAKLALMECAEVLNAALQPHKN